MREYICLLVCVLMLMDKGYSEKLAAPDANLSISALETQVPEGEEKGFKVYSMPVNEFSALLQHPSLCCIAEGSESPRKGDVIWYYEVANSENMIRGETNREGVTVTQESEEGNFRIGFWPVYKSLVDFAGDKAAVKEYLAQNGIAGEVYETTVLYAPHIPVTLWIVVDQKNYFVTLNELPEDYQRFMDSRDYVYRLYDYPTYYGKYAPKEGKLFVNGEEVEDEGHVKIYEDFAEVPFKIIVESLGGEVVLLDDESGILLKAGEEEYFLNTREMTPGPEGKISNILFPVPGGFGVYYIEDNEIILDSNAMEAVLKLMNAQMSLNYDALIVEINSCV